MSYSTKGLIYSHILCHWTGFHYHVLCIRKLRPCLPVIPVTMQQMCACLSDWLYSITTIRDFSPAIVANRPGITLSCFHITTKPVYNSWFVVHHYNKWCHFRLYHTYSLPNHGTRMDFTTIVGAYSTFVVLQYNIPENIIYNGCTAGPAGRICAWLPPIWRRIMIRLHD